MVKNKVCNQPVKRARPDRDPASSLRAERKPHTAPPTTSPGSFFVGAFILFFREVYHFFIGGFYIVFFFIGGFYIIFYWRFLYCFFIVFFIGGFSFEF